MTLDPVLLSRLQWASVIAWHILLPAFTVGLASYIAVLERLYFLTGREIWFRISGFWTRIFAVSFGMGVVSGIIMPFQFGTNWSRFTDAAADVISPLLSYEGLMAFFLEASFLGVLLFGRRLVPAWALFLPPPWLRSERCCRLSGFWRPIHGCRRHRATKWSTAVSSLTIGPPSSSTRRSHIDLRTTLTRST